MEEYIIIIIDPKTLKCLEESKLNEGEKLNTNNFSNNYYWAPEIEFQIGINNIIELQNRLGVEFLPGHLGKLRNYTNNGIVDAIFSRKPEYGIGPGYFRVYPVK